MILNPHISGLRRGAETLLRDLIHERTGFFFDDSKINLLADKFLTLSWLDSPGHRELDGVLLLVRLWLNFHVVTLLVAWQYLWRAAVASALGLCAVDFALSLPFNRPGGLLYPLFLVLSVARLGSVSVVAMGVGMAASASARAEDSARGRASEAGGLRRDERAARDQPRAESHGAQTLDYRVSGEGSLTRQIQEALEKTADTEKIIRVRVNGKVSLEQLSTYKRSALQSFTEDKFFHAEFDEEGLNVAIGNLARSTAARANLELDLKTLADGNLLRSDQEHFLYRVAQEAMANVVRHAQATRLQVVLERVPGEMTLTVADDGVGFDRAGVDTSSHLGLKGMQERADAMGGQLVVESGTGRGTAVRVGIRMEDGV